MVKSESRSETWPRRLDETLQESDQSRLRLLPSPVAVQPIVVAGLLILRRHQVLRVTSRASEESADRTSRWSSIAWQLDLPTEYRSIRPLQSARDRSISEEDTLAANHDTNAVKWEKRQQRHHKGGKRLGFGANLVDAPWDIGDEQTMEAWY